MASLPKTHGPGRGWGNAILTSLVLLGAACSSTTGTAREQTEPGELRVRLEVFAEGLDHPVYITAPWGDPRLFIVEQPGRILVARNGGILPTPFLDITDRVGYGGERGLLGLAFDPDFRATGRFFVSYTDLEGRSVIEGYRELNRGDEADPNSGELYLRVEQPFANHNGGHITFGPDAMLYVGLGDGGGAGDPRGHAQNRSTLLGSILRVDVTQSAAPPYEIPPGNPFVDDPAARGEIWLYGLRNPWRFSFDFADGLLFIGDVGQDTWEEIDVLDTGEGGGNLGWNIMEGPECFGGAACGGDDLVLPVAVYTHEDGCSVTGGYVYRGNRIPALHGRYLYGDYCAGWIRTFRMGAGGTAVDPVELPLPKPGSITSFGEDAQGEVYVVVQEGTVYAIVPEG
ncbi:MAG: PQQ-dependent sugar dehydrogenase [Gemmatimonadota bacterium]